MKINVDFVLVNQIRTVKNQSKTGAILLPEQGGQVDACKEGSHRGVLDREKQRVLTVPRGLTQLPMGAALDAGCCCEGFSCDGGGEERGEWTNNREGDD